jgi:hypothetical protein
MVIGLVGSVAPCGPLRPARVFRRNNGRFRLKFRILQLQLIRN